MTGVLERGKFGPRGRHAHRENDMKIYKEKMAIYKPMIEASKETIPYRYFDLILTASRTLRK